MDEAACELVHDWLTCARHDLQAARTLAAGKESLLDTSQFIATLESRHGLKVACPEEVAYRQQWIDAAQLERLAQLLMNSGYGQYLLQMLKEPTHR